MGLFNNSTAGLLQKTSDLIIFCLNDQLGNYFRKWGKFPRKLYLQIDGGAENANEVCNFILHFADAPNIYNFLI